MSGDVLLCARWNHRASDHGGYGGYCDGLGYNEEREVCPCLTFVTEVKA